MVGFEALAHVGCNRCREAGATLHDQHAGWSRRCARKRGRKHLASVFLLVANMERHLRTLAADLPAAPGDLPAGGRVVLACQAIILRLNELKMRMVDEEDAAAVSECAALLR